MLCLLFQLSRNKEMKEYVFCSLLIFLPSLFFPPQIIIFIKQFQLRLMDMYNVVYAAHPQILFNWLSSSIKVWITAEGFSRDILGCELRLSTTTTFIVWRVASLCAPSQDQVRWCLHIRVCQERWSSGPFPLIDQTHAVSVFALKTWTRRRHKTYLFSPAIHPMLFVKSIVVFYLQLCYLQLSVFAFETRTMPRHRNLFSPAIYSMWFMKSIILFCLYIKQFMKSIIIFLSLHLGFFSASFHLVFLLHQSAGGTQW